MHNILIDNTFGIYYSVSGLQRSSSERGIESEITAILGWAIQRNIPFQEAFTVLVEKKHGLRSKFWALFFSSYEARISFAIIELEKGKPLFFALKKHLSKYLSPYYLAAVEKAENEGKLAEILPQLAENIKFTSSIKDQFKASVTYPVVQFIIGLAFFLGLCVFIIPKFERIFEELSAGMPLPSLFSSILSFSGLISTNSIFKIISIFIFPIFSPMIAGQFNLPHIINTSTFSFSLFVIFQIILLVVVSYLYYQIISRYFRFAFTSIINMIGQILFLLSTLFIMFLPLLIVEQTTSSTCLAILQILFIFLIPYIYFKIIYAVGKFVIFHSVDILIHLPFIGKQVKKIGLLELSGAMATLTGAGYDVLEAAKWNSDTVSGHWLRKKIGNFVKSVESGEDWSDAWEAMHLGSPAHNWIVRNAASRENPYEGFRMLSTWLRDEINSQTNISMRFVEVFCIFFNATFIGITIFAIWHCLWTLIYYMSEF